jgi:ABC-type spermidine/putrescine transport systems, ATPase components
LTSSHFSAISFHNVFQFTELSFIRSIIKKLILKNKMSADVILENITVKFDDFTAVKNADITIKGGEFFSFLGPSGCGKTTLLRAISGFQDPSEGRVFIGGKDMFGIGPNKRPTALIFQNLALFPLMTVWENIAFSLEVKGVGKTKRRKKQMNFWNS